jgi:hypothetical protein
MQVKVQSTPALLLLLLLLLLVVVATVVTALLVMQPVAVLTHSSRTAHPGRMLLQQQVMELTRTSH